MNDCFITVYCNMMNGREQCTNIDRDRVSWIMDRHNIGFKCWSRKYMEEGNWSGTFDGMLVILNYVLCIKSNEELPIDKECGYG